MGYFKSHIRPWILPIIGTMAFILLLTHKSELPVVFNRYSIHYTILLTLAAVNLGLLWRKLVRRVSYQHLIERLAPGPLLSLLLVVISVIFLLDFLGLPRTPSDWVTIVLLGVLFIQVETLREQPIFMSSHLALLFCSLSIALLLLESIFVLFLVESRIPKSQAEFLRLMSSGWPNPISVSKPAGTFRILGLSDSFGLAGGTTSNYHYLLEAMVRREGAATIQMVNISVGAYEPQHQMAILRFAMPYSPDLVLHGFFVGNDFNPYGLFEIYYFLGIPVYKLPGFSPYRPGNFLIKDWGWNALKFQGERARRREQITDEIGTFSRMAFLRIQFERMNVWGKRGEESVGQMKKILPVLDAIRSAAEDGGAQYVMVIHPDQTQIDEHLRREIITTFQVDENDYDFDLPQKVLRSYCEDRGIPCLDLLPSVREKSNDGKLYLLHDTHYNQAGNELAATRISQFLRDRQLLHKVRETSAAQAQARE